MFPRYLNTVFTLFSFAPLSFLFSFFDFFSSLFHIPSVWSSRSEVSPDAGDRLGFLVFSKDRYRCTGLGAYVFFVCILFCCWYALPYHRMYIHAYILLDALRQLALPPGYLCIRLYVYPVLLFIFLCIPLFAILFNIILLLCTPYYTDKIKHFLYIFIYIFLSLF